MRPINPLISGKKFINYHDYEDLINKHLNKLATLFTKNFKGIQHSLVKKTFWELVDGKIIDDPTNFYIRLAYIAGRIIMFDILFQKRKISNVDRKLRNEWFKFIFGRILKFEDKIPSKFFATIFSHLPVVDQDSMVSLYEEMIRLFEKSELKKILNDPQEDPYEKIMKFKEFFSKYYETFLGRCEFIGNELGKHEGNKNYGNNFKKIFQLRERDNAGNIISQGNERSPPIICDDTLNILYHIRNAISHSGKCVTVIKDKESIRFRDFNNKGICTFDRIYTFHELWIICYHMMILDREFETITLTIAVARQIREANKIYGLSVKCHNCGKIDYYYLPPQKNQITCRKCNSKLKI